MDYKQTSDRVWYEYTKTFRKNPPEFSLVMKFVKKFGADYVVKKFGEIRESPKEVKDWNKYLIGVFKTEVRITNIDRMLSAIRGELAGGKFLVLPTELYKQVIPLLKEKGWADEELKNIKYESEFLKQMKNK